MVRLLATPAAKLAIDEYCITKHESSSKPDGAEAGSFDELSTTQVGDCIDHSRLVEISRYLVNRDKHHEIASKWRVDVLLRGAAVYQPPPPARSEPTPQYKALMQNLREQEEQRQYERMTNPLPQAETFKQRFPNSPYDFNPAISHGQSAAYDVVDEVTYADVNRQVILIINVLVSIVACSIAIWIAARRWSVPQRLALSLSGSGVVAIAEVAIYLGYINRIDNAKNTERKLVEQKEIVETWVIDKAVAKQEATSVRLRKGKHR